MRRQHPDRLQARQQRVRVRPRVGGPSRHPEAAAPAVLRVRRGAMHFALVALAIVVAQAAWGQDVEAGRKKAESCVACHGPNGNSTNPVFPILAGQTARYIYLQLRDFQEGRRREPQMDSFVAKLTREDMFDLAAFFATQKPAPTAFKPDP